MLERHAICQQPSYSPLAHFIPILIHNIYKNSIVRDAPRRWRYRIFSIDCVTPHFDKAFTLPKNDLKNVLFYFYCWAETSIAPLL